MRTASLLVIAIAGISGVLAQPLRASEAAPCGAHSFDTAKVEKVSGKIAKVGAPGMGHHGKGAHAWIETSSGTLEVMLGPADYLKAQGVQLAPGDQVEIAGWRTQMMHGEMFVASEIRRGNESIRLRDEKGAPAWAKAGEGGPGCNDGECPCGGGHGAHGHH